MKTYLTLFFDSEGATPSAVAAALAPLGFKPTRGPHDFVYDWTDVKDVNEVVWFGDKVQAALKGKRVLFKLETVG